MGQCVKGLLSLLLVGFASPSKQRPHKGAVGQQLQALKPKVLLDTQSQNSGRNCAARFVRCKEARASICRQYGHMQTHVADGCWEAMEAHISACEKKKKSENDKEDGALQRKINATMEELRNSKEIQDFYGNASNLLSHGVSSQGPIEEFNNDCYLCREGDPKTSTDDLA